MEIGTTSNRTRLIEELRAVRVIPVIRTRLTQEARTAIQWLLDVGFRTFEVTLTVPDAISLIRDLSTDRSLLIGAGTVPNEAAARSCIAAGRASSSRLGSIGLWPALARKAIRF